MGIWDKVGKVTNALATAADRMTAVNNLMEMSESAGMTHLGVLVPRTVDEGWFDGLISMLRTRENDTSVDHETRQKAKTFRVHAEGIARRYR
jgi:hypothetical protein